MHTDKEIISKANALTPPPHEAPSSIIKVNVERNHPKQHESLVPYTIVYKRREEGESGWDPIEIIKH